MFYETQFTTNTKQDVKLNLDMAQLRKKILVANDPTVLTTTVTSRYHHRRGYKPSWEAAAISEQGSIPLRVLRPYAQLLRSFLLGQKFSAKRQR